LEIKELKKPPVLVFARTSSFHEITGRFVEGCLTGS
jgi:hypothetical protein